MTNFQIISSALDHINLNIDNQMLSSFSKFSDMLLEYNKNINLTAIEQPTDIAVKHFIDSLALLSYTKLKGPVVDIGTGAGFPGIPLAITLPNINFTLIDSIQKRTVFLNEVKQNLSLNNVTIINNRSEVVAHCNSCNNNNLKENFVTAVARGVAPLYKLVELCLPFVSVGGTFIAYKGSNSKEEIIQAQKAISTLGGKVSNTVFYTLPSTNIKRSLIFVSKISQSPSCYPRKPNKIKNNPIL